MSNCNSSVDLPFLKPHCELLLRSRSRKKSSFLQTRLSKSLLGWLSSSAKKTSVLYRGGSGIVGPFLVPRSFWWTNADPFLQKRINRRTCHNTHDTWYCIATATWNFLISALWSWWTQHQNFFFLFLNINTVLSNSRKFRQHSHIKWNWIRSMTSETVRIHFLSDVFVCCHPEVLLPWQRDATRSPLYLTG